MTNEKADKLVNGLLQTTTSKAIPVLRAFKENKGEGNPVGEVSKIILPQILAMNSGDSAELLAMFIAGVALAKVEQAMKVHGALERLFSGTKEQFGETPDSTESGR